MVSPLAVEASHGREERSRVTLLAFSQIEHHLWPDLSMLSYQKAAPLVKAICEKHQVPYVQQSVFWCISHAPNPSTSSPHPRVLRRRGAGD